ncbi:hypothetical protein [Pseudoalteromonas denitrificans]|jgi:hypothetical protein|uniref:Uncharacterized protein n=1 Tax=Pseudoalteromonas denitrificans DSM 6059 TaxID=1123010 RepID=A0A1I1SQK3_9GAMM|nr:hypothetical protein [Pseudoalteromonas denitrificans]SFD48759.1 hypothetical protein SAMN02745724_04655 [Pseudoalteromonas denitrificans DSM 6059]
MKQITEFELKEVGNKNEFWGHLEKECQAMAEHAFSKGLKVPANIMKVFEKMVTKDKVSAEELTDMHNRLAELISPAKPETIVLMAREKEKGSIFLFLGRVPLIRRMMLVAIVSLSALIGLSLSQYINNENMVTSMFDMEGARLLYVQTILLASAAIGASFSALFKANSYVTAGIYDPKYESSYWVRFVVGLIAGIILTQLIPINLDAVAKAASEASGTTASGVSHAAIRITMALVGGFSANLVYKILDRIVETVQSFISPVQAEDPEVIKQMLTNKFNQQQLVFISGLASELLNIQQKLGDEDFISKKEIQRILSEYLTFITSSKENMQ